MGNFGSQEKFSRTLDTSPEETDLKDLEVLFRHLRFAEGLQIASELSFNQILADSIKLLLQDTFVLQYGLFFDEFEVKISFGERPDEKIIMVTIVDSKREEFAQKMNFSNGRTLYGMKQNAVRLKILSVIDELNRRFQSDFQTQLVPGTTNLGKVTEFAIKQTVFLVQTYENDLLRETAKDYKDTIEIAYRNQEKQRISEMLVQLEKLITATILKHEAKFQGLFRKMFNSSKPRLEASVFTENEHNDIHVLLTLSFNLDASIKYTQEQFSQSQDAIRQLSTEIVQINLENDILTQTDAVPQLGGGRLRNLFGGKKTLEARHFSYVFEVILDLDELN